MITRMDTIQTRESGSDEPVTLYIGGATYAYPDDYDGLVSRLNGKHIVANNPFHNGMRRPGTWERELTDGYAEVCRQKGVTEVIAHSRGCLQALMLREAVDLDRIVLLHPPVKQCVMSARARLKMIGDYAKLDELLAQTCDGMDDDQYRAFIERHHFSYGMHPGKLVNMLRYDAANIPLEELHARMHAMDSDTATKYLIVNGERDPWYDPNITVRNHATVTLEDQGHFSQISMPEDLSAAISDWRQGKPILIKKKEPGFIPATVEADDGNDGFFATF